MAHGAQCIIGERDIKPDGEYSFINVQGMTSERAYAYWACHKENRKGKLEGPRALIVLRHFIVLIKTDSGVLSRAIKIVDIQNLYVLEDKGQYRVIVKVGAKEPTLVLRMDHNLKNIAGTEKRDPTSVLRVINYFKEMYSGAGIRCYNVVPGTDIRSKQDIFGGFTKSSGYVSPREKLKQWKTQKHPTPVPRPPVPEPEKVDDQVVVEDANKDEAADVFPPVNDAAPVDAVPDAAPTDAEMLAQHVNDEILPIEEEVDLGTDGIPGDDDEDYEDDYYYDYPPPVHHRPPPPPPLDESALKSEKPVQRNSQSSGDPPHVHLHLFMHKGDPSAASVEQRPLEIDDNLPSVHAVDHEKPPPAYSLPSNPPISQRPPSQPSHPPPRISVPVALGPGPGTPAGSAPWGEEVEFEKFPLRRSEGKQKSHATNQNRSGTAQPQDASAFKEGFIQGFVAATGGVPLAQSTQRHDEASIPPSPAPAPVSVPMRAQSVSTNYSSPSPSPSRRSVVVQPYAGIPRRNLPEPGREGSLPRQLAQERVERARFAQNRAQLTADRAAQEQLRESERERVELATRLQEAERQLGNREHKGKGVYERHDRSSRRRKHHQTPTRTNRDTTASDREAALMRSIQNGQEADRRQNQEHSTVNWAETPVSPRMGRGRSTRQAAGTAATRSPRRHKPESAALGKGKYWSSFINEWDTQYNY
eukprot:TRINITY_DN291_c1_g1_i2.p1 TRINITY_DN291_c1_g1~~TRINITY_DN291_c1_g1_i2.p1  ORF type:complete len:748 (+),score=164.53 TRINITY_DN291_c1_g1_i2:147-2246(+)